MFRIKSQSERKRSYETEGCAQRTTLIGQCMAKHVFGGDWTNDKLERVRKYLREYTKIFSRNERASYFTTIYVDAFAGTGERADSSSGRTNRSASILNEED